MLWVLVVIYSANNGEELMRSYHEYKTKEECVRQSERVKNYPHPYGLKITLLCNQTTNK